MSNLRSNVLSSIAALLIVGAIRPTFHAAVQRLFGAEINGHAATLVSLIFLASLPATASLPTVMVRHVSLALSANQEGQARAHVRLASLSVLILSCLAAVTAPYVGPLLSNGSPLGSTDVILVTLGILGYSYWRLVRGLFVATGQPAFGLRSDLISVLALPMTFYVIWVSKRPEWVVLAYDSVFLLFALVTFLRAAEWWRSAELERSVTESFLRYNLFGLIGTATSLAAREMAVLVLGGRASRSEVGDFSIALSFLTLLAFAPRVLELPLISELSKLSGKQEHERARELTETALHRLFFLVFSISAGAAILAQPILSLGGASNRSVMTAFAVLAFAFGSEMAQSPATNLLISDAHPRVLAMIGTLSLLAACAWWWLDPEILGITSPVLRVVLGLCVSHAVKAIAIAGYAALRFRVRAFSRPTQKVPATLIGLLSVIAAHSEMANPFAIAFFFSVAMLLLFASEARALLASLLKR